MIVSHLPVLQVVVPLLAALIVAVVRSGTVSWMVTFLVSSAMPFIAFALLFQLLSSGPFTYEIGGWVAPFGIEYRVDFFTCFMLIIVSFICVVAVPYARLSIASEVSPGNQPFFYSLYLLFITGLFGIIMTGDAFNAFVFMEISSLSSYGMIAMGRDRNALVAAYQYLIIGTIGASFYVIAVGLLYIMTGTLNLVDISERLRDVESMRPVLAAFVFLFVGLGVKFALFPLHLWLPNAYAYAPCFSAAILSGTATKVSGYLLVIFIFRVFGVSFEYVTAPVISVFFFLAVLGIIIASVAAVFQDNVKRVLAYSSVAQVGYMMLGIYLANLSGLTGAIVHFFNHALIKSALFLAVGSVFYRLGDVHLRNLSGIGKQMPLTMAAFVLASVSLIGLPGTAGFVSKWYLAQGALERGMWPLVILLVFSSVIAVIYMGRILEVAYFGEPSSSSVNVREAPASMLVPLWVLALSSIYFGFDTRFSVGMASKVAETLLMGSG
ncbi:MAG: monovalent cation/H+ antiporter subunit D family protein [Alphaproteobacteria bacterium]|nr:monovalent cation/H+ antiporter subunit D family protein [Alphaproteobacteria bacterium]